MEQMAKKLQNFVVQSRNSISQLEQFIGYTLQELMILTHLQDNSLKNDHNVYAIDLQEKLYLSRSSASVLINSLVKRELLLRQHDERNRKKTLLIVTLKGKESLEQANKQFARYIEQIKEIFEEEKFHKYIELNEEFTQASNSQLIILNEK